MFVSQCCANDVGKLAMQFFHPRQPASERCVRQIKV
jgi:hypothetical protein